MAADLTPNPDHVAVLVAGGERRLSAAGNPACALRPVLSRGDWSHIVGPILQGFRPGSIRVPISRPRSGPARDSGVHAAASPANTGARTPTAGHDSRVRVIGVEVAGDGGQLGMRLVKTWIFILFILKPIEKGGGDVDAVVQLKLVIHSPGVSWDESPNVYEMVRPLNGLLMADHMNDRFHGRR